ncbi:MAG: tetratricopeptide repeat protein [Trebonia sp.]
MGNQEASVDTNGGRHAGVNITGGQGIQVGDNSTQYNYYVTQGGQSDHDWPALVGSLPQGADCFQRRPEQERLITTYWSANTIVLVQVLAGMGGAGKTQLAADFAKTQWERRTVDLLIWVNASSKASIIASYAVAAARIGTAPAGGTGNLDAVVGRFLSWLAEKSDKKWLIVLDDVADARDLVHLKPPLTSWGHTIITTRQLDRSYYARGWERVEVGLFTAEQARQYLRNRLSDYPDALTGVDKLAEDLGYLPLALASASADIRCVLDSHGHLGGPVSCAEYSDLLADQQRRLVDIMHTEQTDEYERTLAATWSLSIERVDQQLPSGIAHRLMELLSLLDPNGIPFEVLGTPEVHAYLRSQSPEEIRVALRALRLFSLIEFADADSELVRIHVLVQRAVRETAGSLEDAARALAGSIVSRWPEHQHRSSSALLLRGNALALYNASPGPLQASGLHPLLFLLGDGYGRAGLMDQAREYFNRLREQASATLGADSRDALHARQRDAYWLGFSGRNEESLAEFTALAADQGGVLGPDDVDTLVSRHNIARFRGRSGDPQGAVDDLVRLVDDEARALGPDHSETLKSRNILGYWRSKAGDGPGAVLALEELLTIRIRLNGPDHPETLTTRNDLGIAKADIGDYAGAAVVTGTLAQDRARALGPEAPETLSSKAYIAYWRAMAGDRGGTVELETIVGDHVRVLGDRHRNTLRAQAYLIEARAAVGDTTIEEATAEMTRHLEVIRAAIDSTDIVFTHCQRKLAEWENAA